MTKVAEELIRKALKLAPIDRATLIEELLSSLDKPDSGLDAMWAKEAEDRLGAYRAGEIEATPANEVFAELGRT